MRTHLPEIAGFFPVREAGFVTPFSEKRNPLRNKTPFKAANRENEKKAVRQSMEPAVEFVRNLRII
jgi:hypothetical protein